MTHASDSSVQREAEAQILDSVAEHIGVRLAKRRVDLPGGSWVEVDGVTDDLSVFAEAFARQGPMKGGQKRKVALDVLKLITLRRHHPDARVLLGFCDAGAAESLTGWVSEAIQTWEVETLVVPIDEDLRVRLVEVQARQYR